MTGINKKRFGIWVAIFVVFLLLGGGGFALNYTGYGKAGKIREEVSDYITKFNALTQVREINSSDNKNIKASLSDEGIVVNYKNDKITSKLDFTFKNTEGFKYLETVYNKNESNPETIVRLMIDAVGLKNGTAEGRIFDTYEYSDFYSTTLSQGVKLQASGSNVKVQINLRANVLANVAKTDTGDNTSYVIINDTSKQFSDFVNYTTPTQFTRSNRGYEFSTANNTCTMEFNVVSKETAEDALALANMIASGENTSTTTQSINDSTWNRISYTSKLGGTVNRFTIDVDDNILMFEYNSYYPNEECDTYLDTLLNTIKVK